MENVLKFHLASHGCAVSLFHMESRVRNRPNRWRGITCAAALVTLLSRRSSTRHFLIITLSALVFPHGTLAQCLSCHGQADFSVTDPSSGGVVSLYVDSAVFFRSIHGSMDCTACHVDADTIPHSPDLAPVDCGNCHSDIAEEYEWHGLNTKSRGQFIPACYDCHTKHNILPPSDTLSAVYADNLPGTCGRCHEDSSIVSQYHIPMLRPVEVFETSVHSQKLGASGHIAADCIDCHSVEGTAHRILAPIFPQSSIYHFNIPGTCGRCHREIEDKYRRGAHGRASAKGEVDAPVCTGCHSAHQILAVDNPRSLVSPTNVSMTTCAPCHDNETLNIRYGFPPNLLESWRHSYHGLKSTDGDPTVATCVSCHRAHLILPQSDSASSVAPANVRQTCAKCHSSITAELAGIEIHATRGIFLNSTARSLRAIYIVAILIIIGAMFIHWVIELLRRIVDLNRGKQVVRMRADELWQHTLLMISFTVLAITGFAFHYSGSWWADWLFGWPGGFQFRGIVHRIASVIFVLTAVWHLVYLCRRRGRQFMRDIFPTTRDFVQFYETMAFDLRLRKQRPRFGRFNYVEKAEYWALVWGTVVMIMTGFGLWFGHITQWLFDIGALGVMLVVHFYEAILASLAILIWHFYSTIFSPTVYPNNPSWYTGKMPLEMFRGEHSDVPIRDEVVVEEKPGRDTE
jgi:cytochrome b subunit of formate dehydrogenase